MDHHYNSGSFVKNYKDESLSVIKKIGKPFAMHKDELLHSKDLFYLVKGLCALCIPGESGRDISLIYFTPGRLVNFMPSLNEYYPRTRFKHVVPVMDSQTFIKAISESQFIRINRDIFYENYFQSLPLQTLIIQALIDNSYDLFFHIINSLERPVWQRVAMLVYELEQFHINFL